MKDAVYKKKVRLAIIGASAFGMQVHHWADITGHYIVVGYFDDFAEKGKLVKNKPILGKLSDVEKCYSDEVFDELFLAIGYKHNSFKQAFFLRLKGKIPFATIIVSPAYIDPTAEIGENVLICPACVVSEDCVIEDNVQLLTQVNISHNTRIKTGTYCSPSVNIAGFATIGQCCFLGIGSTVVDGVQISDNVIIGAQALVLRDINEEGTYIGIPVRKK